MDQYWVPHDESVWTPGVKTSAEGDKVTFQISDGGKVVVPKAKTESLALVQPAQLEGVDDVCKLGDVNAGSLLHTVRTRYGKKLIYTRVARILIAVNPFEPLNIYSSAYLDKFMKAVDSLEMEPHVYAIGLDAVMGLRQGKEFGSGKNQAVLISGESGAGKTESTKLVLTYIAEAIGGRGSLQEQILQTNPILESFGNAMTVRNNNSSRFGKWLEMSISPSMTITGCTITDYLLELTRVITQGAKERNYHIFFQVVQARGRSEMSSIGILPVEEYTYLRGGQKHAPGIKDDDCFEELKDAFSALSFTDEWQLDIFKVVAGILFLGNCEFTEAGEKASLANDAPAKKAAELLGFSLNELIVAMTVKKLTVGKDVAQTPLTKAGASAARDGLSRLLYGKLFKWLITRVNSILHKGTKGGDFFGVLDIAGFESFEHNSLEQLFINLSNEHLQQHFNNHIFKMELEDYAKEGITAGEGLTYQDNSDVVVLIGAPGTGILSILDEEAIFSKATDQTFTAKVFKAHDKHVRLNIPKFAGAIKFGLRHFAGEVTYSCEGWLEKNIDKPPEDAPGMLKSSTNSVLKEVGAEIAAEQLEASNEGMSRRASATSKKKPKTLGSGFRTSLAALVDKLNEAEPHFIRCVKPNAEKVPSRFTARLVMEQLTFSGIMEAVRIRQQGYASRVPFDEFCGKYKCILPKPVQKKISEDEGLTGAARTMAVLEALPSAVSVVGVLNPKDFVVGKTKVLGKITGVSLLDKSRDLALSGYALDIQRIFRGVAVRRQMREVRAVFCAITAWVKKNMFYGQSGSEYTALAMLKSPEAIDEQVSAIEELLTSAASLPITLPDLDKVGKVKQRMISESTLAKQFKDLQKSVDPVEVGKALARAKDLDIHECDEAKVLAVRLEKLKVQTPLVQAMREALESNDAEKLSSCMDAVKKEGLHQRPENWIDELKAEDLAGRVYDATTKITASKKKTEMESRLKVEQDDRVQKERGKSGQFLEFEAAPERKKSDRKTVTGMTEQDQAKLLLALAAACHEYDIEALEERLGEATKQGLDPAKLEPSVKMMNDLQSEEFLAESIKQMQEEVVSDCPPAHCLKCLQNLVAQAKRLDVASDLVDECRPVMQQGVRRRARTTIKGSIFDNVDISELNLGEDTFSDLGTFPNLKPAAQWRGHRTGTLFSRSQGKDGGDNKVMLSHSKQEIKAALTKVAFTQETPAVQQFRNLLGWMSDRPVAECQRLGYSQDIISAAKSDTGLGDEIYVQVMKQLTQNPSRRSALLGWKLLLMLCQQVCPSEGLEEFLRAFLITALRRNQETGFDEAVTIAKQCIPDLNASISRPMMRTSAIESEDMTIPVQVYLIDNSTRKVFIGQSQTLKTLGERVAESLKISNYKDFSFFQMTDGLDTHRLLPEQTVLNTLSEKWMKLKEVTQRTSRLLWKRRFIRVDELLQAGDLIHATLTYRQALWDYHHYPLPEDCKFMAQVGATLLHHEKDHYADYIKNGKLGDVGVLEQLLPEVSIRHQKRPKWAQQLLDEFHKLRKILDLDAQETRLQQMSRVMSTLQRMKLFGTYFWLGKQTYHVPKEKQGLPEGKAPAQMCKINAKDPEAEYWICVDLYGVRFLSVDAAPGAEFQRGFLFNDEAVERVILWGAKQNVVQFVVQTLNPAFPAAGRIPMTIALISPAAVDVAYAVHTISNDRKRQKC